MRSLYRNLATLAVSTALLFSPAMAAASAPAPQAPSADGWLALSMLTPSGAAVLGETGIAAAQAEVPPSPPTAEGTGVGVPPIPVLVVLAAVVAVDIYIATKNHNHRRIPNSPV